MAGGLVAAIGHAYRDPRGAMARQVDAGLSEPRALAHLMMGCGLAFVASAPNAVRSARLIDAPDPLAAAVSAHFFGYLFVAPLLVYGLAALAHLVARGFGGRAGYLGARSALFWSVLLAGPIALALSLAGAAAEALRAGDVLLWLDYLVYAGASFWLWLLSASLAEAEGFSGTGRVAAALAGAFAVVAVGVAVGVGALAPAAG